jgi:DNA-binding sugar fermentation-stimulating protein
MSTATQVESGALSLPRAATPAMLAAALEREARLLDALVQVLRRQREAIAAADAGQIDECVHAAHRVLLTLSEARRHRRVLLGVLAGSEDAPIRSLETALGATATTQVLAARDRLQQAAALASREVAVNRQVIEAALAAGDAQLRLLRGISDRPLAYDSRAQGVEEVGSGTLINRQA